MSAYSMDLRRKVREVIAEGALKGGLLSDDKSLNVS